MKQYKLYNVPESTESFFQPFSMLSVARWRSSTPSAEKQLDTNIWPAAELFNNKTFEETNGGWILINNRIPCAFVEKANPEIEGCDYRWYNNQDKSKATECRVLVYGDTRFDSICENVGVEVQPQDDGSVILHNITTINGEDYRTFDTNRSIRLKGFEFGVTNVIDGTFGSIKYLRVNEGYNQLGSQYGLDDIRIALAPYTGVADYVLSVTDQNDANEEFFFMCFIRGVKNMSQYLRIPIKELFTV